MRVDDAHLEASVALDGEFGPNLDGGAEDDRTLFGPLVKLDIGLIDRIDLELADGLVIGARHGHLDRFTTCLGTLP